LIQRPLRWFCAVAGVAALLVADLPAQIVPHPYDLLSVGDRTIERFISDGMVHRANIELRTLRSEVERSSAIDNLPFDRAEIDRGYGHAASADRGMREFAADRPNSPLVPFAVTQRALAAVEEGDDPRAAELFAIAAERSERESQRRTDSAYVELAHFARFWQGASQARIGLHSESIASFRACVAADSTGSYADRALYAIGQVYERNGDLPEAIAAFREIRSHYPQSQIQAAARAREAEVHLRMRQPERAIDALVDIEQLNLSSDLAEQVSVLRLSAVVMRGRYDFGQDSCRVFLDRYPASMYRPLVHLIAGFTHLYRSQPDSALVHCDAVLALVASDADPVRQQALLYRAVALQRTQRTKEAANAFADLAARSDYPFQAQALIELGQMAYVDGRFDQARTSLEKAERTSTDATTTIRAGLLLGAVHIEEQRWKVAAETYGRVEVLAQKADDAFVPGKERYLAEARLKRGICLVQANDTRNAIVTLTDFLAHHPDHPERSEATFWLAESMYRADLLKNAEELYEEIVHEQTASPRREEAMYGLAWTYFRRRNFVRSVDAFGDLLTTYPKSRYAVEALVRRGDGLYITKQYKAAARQYEEAARRGRTAPEGLYAGYQAGEALYRAGDLDEASNRLRAFVAAHSSSRLADDALFLLGWISFQQRNDAAAIVEFKRLLEAYPDGDHAVRALYTLADAEYNLGNIDAALAAYRQVITRYPTHPLATEAAKSLQLALMGMGDTDGALAVADEVINANPSSTMAEEFRFKKAEIFYSGKNYANAASELQAYIQKYPGSERADEATYLLGKSFLTMDDVAQATTTFKELERKFPKSSFVGASKLELAQYFDSRANATSADSLYAIVIRDHASDTAIASQAGFERATITRMRGDSIRALDQYRIVANTYPGTEFGDQARYQIAQYFRKNRQYDSAREELAILTRTTPDQMIIANALYEMGDMYTREKRWNDAIPLFTRVREDYAGNEDWYTLSLIALGGCFEQINDPLKAKEAYGIVAELRPDDDYGKTAKARVDRLEKKRR
jgi:TolA-binding protein